MQQLQPENLWSYTPIYAVISCFYMFLILVCADVVFFATVPSIFQSLSKPQKLEWGSNLASLINSTLTGVGSLASLVGAYLGLISLQTQYCIMQVMVISMTGYSVADTLFRIGKLKQLAKPVFQSFLIAHHVVAVYAVQIALLYKECYTEKNLFLLMELSTFFINVRLMLLDAKVPRDSFLYEGVSVTMIVSFFVTRLLPIPILYYLVGYRCAYLGASCSSGNRLWLGGNTVPYTIITLMNLHWFQRMWSGWLMHLSDKKQGHVSQAQKENEVFDTDA